MPDEPKRHGLYWIAVLQHPPEPAVTKGGPKPKILVPAQVIAAISLENAQLICAHKIPQEADLHLGDCEVFVRPF